MYILVSHTNDNSYVYTGALFTQVITFMYILVLCSHK